VSEPEGGRRRRAKATARRGRTNRATGIQTTTCAGSPRSSLLLVDIGNTRVKWARLEGARLGRLHAAPYAGWTQEDFARRVVGSGRGIRRIVAVSVAGDRVERLLSAAARERIGIEPEFFRSRRRVAGLTTLYSEPWRLGADRLVAAIGAHRIADGRDVCFVMAGTALTVDLVDAQGRHRGGAIIPAPGLMQHSLLTRTNGIRRRAAGGSARGSLFARSTRAAIEHGTRHAAAALIDRAVQEAQGILGRKPLVLLAGGAAPALRPLLRTPHRFVPDLVLRGLAVLASTAPDGRR
jgi:type III pantothenate kinase